MEADDQALDGVPFVPAGLDDAGLSAAEFRVFCRIARRSDSGRRFCWESIPNLAAGCRLKDKTVRSVLKRLVSIGMVRIDSRPGQCSVITPIASEHWRHPSPKRPPLPKQTTSPKRKGSGSPKQGDTPGPVYLNPSPKGPDEGASKVPRKVPKEGEAPPIPAFEPIRKGTFRDKIDAWIVEAEAQRDRLKEDSRLTERVLRNYEAEQVAKLKEEGNEARARAIHEDPGSWTTKLNTAGKQHHKAWTERIAELKAKRQTAT